VSAGASSTLPVIGIVGGIGPESTIDYYRALLAGYARRVPDGSAPTMTIQSIDLQRGLTFLDAGDLEGLTTYLVDAVTALARAGAGFALLSANSPHVVFDELARRVSIPLLSIVEATCAAVRAAGRRRLALLGTRFTMEGSFYPEVFGRAGLELAVPEPDERQWLHEKYLGELVPGNFLPETRAGVLELIDRLNNWAAGAVILDTPQTRTYFVDRLGLRPEKAHVAYVGAETALFYPRPRPEQTDGSVRVLFYGTFIPLQGIDIIIKAAAEVQREMPTVRFQLVGSGQTSSENRALAGQFQARNITFGPAHVPYEQLPELIAGADIGLGIFADRPKTARVIPNKLYQCAAMGIPVITADTPAVRAGFGAGELALVPSGDHHALAAAVLALASDPQRRRQIGAAGLRAVHSRYSPRAVATQVLEACQSII